MIMHITKKALLRSAVATSAMVLAPSAANAACTTANGVVTCTDVNTAAQVTAAVNSAPPPSVSLIIAQGATVIRPNNQITPFNPPFDGAISYTNNGTVGGSPADFVDFSYNGTITAPTNTFTFNNAGTQNGGILAFNVGGVINGTNTGTITRGIDLSNAGAINLTSSGTVYNTTSSTAINLLSRLQQSSTATTGTRTTTTTTSTGGIITANITGPVAVPAVAGPPAVAAVPQNINAQSIAGVNLTVNNVAGNITANTRTNFTPTSFTQAPVTNGAVTTDSNGFFQTIVGGDGTVVVGANGQVGNVNVTTGTGAATATINGSVGTTAAPASVNVRADGLTNDVVFTNTTTAGAVTTTTNAVRQVIVRNGGSATASVNDGASVLGGVTATSNAGPATVNVAGTVGNFAAGIGGNVNASSGFLGFNFTFDRSLTSNSDGTFNNVTTETASAAGQAVTVNLAASADVNGPATAQSCGGPATVDNAGRVRGGVTATANCRVRTAFDDRSSLTQTTAANGTVTRVSSTSRDQTNQNVGGLATVTNRSGAVIEGSVFVNGLTGANFNNAGAVFGNVNLTSRGTIDRNIDSDRTTTTTVPAGTTTVLRETSNVFRSTPNGGIATGVYSGTVGAVAGSPLAGFRSVFQQGDQGSVATVTGTLFADFTGLAGAQTRDRTFTTTQLTVTQPATAPATAASERTTSNSTRDNFTEVASTSSLTVSGGRIATNGFNGGNVTLDSRGGNANLSLTAGGTIAGSADVRAGTGTNRTFSQDNQSIFTTAATAAGPVPAEVQQSQTSSQSDRNLAAPGTANVTLASGTSVGGNLNVAGTGTGAGTLGANVTIDGTLGISPLLGGGGGQLTVRGSRLDTLSTSSDNLTRTSATRVDRVVTNAFSSAPSANGGGLLVNVGGTVRNGIDAQTEAGPATVNVTGQVNTNLAGGTAVTVRSIGAATESTTTQNFRGTNFGNANTQTGFSSSSSSTATGGIATLSVAGSAAVLAANASSIEGNIAVAGRTGSVMTVTAGSRVLQSIGSAVNVGQTFANSTGSETRTFNAAGAQTGSTTTNTSTAVGGPASLTNPGIIGSGANFVFVNVQSVGGASATNSGIINGTLLANALGSNTSTTTVVTNANDPVLTQTVTTTRTVPVGGAASISNSGLITSSVTARGATGTVTNDGVIRGSINVGATAAQGALNTTVVRTQTATSDNFPGVSTANTPAFTQTYTVNQNGLLLGGVNVTGGATVSSTVNLNNNSITLGNIVATGTNTNVNLNGSGFLGVASNDVAVITNTQTSPGFPTVILPATGNAVVYNPTPSLSRFGTIDPTLGSFNQAGVFVPSLAANALQRGSRITGVNTVTKTGDGTFVIVGSPLIRNGTAAPTYTMELGTTAAPGTFRINAGEVQLGVATDPNVQRLEFGIRGSIENNATLVVGRRITNGVTSAVQGINLLTTANFTNSGTGNLVVGVAPALVRQAGSPLFLGTAPSNFGFGGGGVLLTPFVPVGQSNVLTSTGSFVTVDGNLSLGGRLTVASGNTGGIFNAGRAYDLFNVGGTYTNSSTIASDFSSPFISFVLTPRSEGGRTIVSLDVRRAAFNTVTANDRNATAAADALQATIPGVIGRITTANSTGNFGSAETYGLVQDLATVISAIDTQMTSAQASQAFRELSSGEFYGSLTAVRTTAAFGEAVDTMTSNTGPAGLGLWLRPTGEFSKFDFNNEAGASGIRAQNYGGSVGVNYATGTGGNFGLAGGYSRNDVNARTTPERADADTYMIGAYGSQGFGPMSVSGQLVMGWSQWNASRVLPTFSRTATSEFDSRELRGNLRISYDLPMGTGLIATPFVAVEGRKYRFDAFEEKNGGGIGLAVERSSKTVFSPEVGARVGGAFGSLRPFAELSYVFQGDIDGERRMAFLGARDTSFVVEGVDPRGYVRGALGVSAAIGRANVFLRGEYGKGGDHSTASVRTGLLFNF